MYTISFSDQSDAVELLIEDVLGGFLRFGNEPLSLENNVLSNIKIYPNPAQSVITIVGSTAPFSTMEIIDAQGKIVIIRKDGISGIDVSGLEAGIYFVKMTSGNRTAIRKLIKS